MVQHDVRNVTSEKRVFRNLAFNFRRSDEELSYDDHNEPGGSDVGDLGKDSGGGQADIVSTLVDRWQAILQDSKKPWILFENGTCVILAEPEGDPASQAIELMKEWGPVQVATPSADFSVIHLVSVPGWLVTCHHRDILTYVNPDEINRTEPNEVLVGLTGRSKRDQDAQELEILFIADRQANNTRSESAGFCECLVTPQSNRISFRELGMDSRFAEASILICPKCGRHWLRYFYENEAFSASGRWYLGLITEEQSSTLIANGAKSTLEGLIWYFYGGSYFQGRKGKGSGPIFLNP